MCSDEQNQVYILPMQHDEGSSYSRELVRLDTLSTSEECFLNEKLQC